MSRLLLGDIGGTYARFALAEGAVVGPVWSTEVGARLNVIEAIRAFIDVGAHGASIEGALLATAGPVEGGRCRLVNAAWIIDEEEIARAFGFSWVRVVNDLEAVAAGLPDLTAAQTRLIGPDTSLVGAPMAVIAPGTGLGMACLIAGPGGRCVVTSEGGHASLAGIDAKHDRLIAVLRKQCGGHVSVERALSGGGLRNLYLASAVLAGAKVESRTAAQITEGAFNGTCPMCRDAVDAFCAFLGAVAGDIALTFGARGGVFIGGGIVPRFVDYLARSAFRAQFEAKGRLQPYVSRVPTRVIMHPNPAFPGLMSLVNSFRRRPRPAMAR